MDPYTYYYSFYHRNHDELIKALEKAILGEYNAIQCYEKLANLATATSEKNQILEIRQDEVKHLQHFTHIYMNLVGREPEYKVTEECPGTYQKGLEFAFLDEQETVDFYLDMYDQINDPFIRGVFQRAAADEQNHAVWFLYLLSKRNW